MLEDYYAPYREYLRPGMRIEMGIPLSGGGVFRDWAVISESEGDDLLVQISRDVLPANVRIDEGFILDVSIWVKKEVYTCSGIVTERQDGRILKVRLFGAFMLRERRQFFRIVLPLRIRYALLGSPELKDVERDWEQRKNLEQMKFQGYDQIVIAAQQARYRPVIPLEWHDLLRTEVNLGGGGILVRLPEQIHPEKLLALEIQLPGQPPRLVQTVAEVLHVQEPKPGKDGTHYTPAGMRFMFLDERDRDLIFRHISVTQIEHLRKKAERHAPDGLPEEPVLPPEPITFKKLLPRLVLGGLVLVILAVLVRYLLHFREEGSPNEIKSTYEKAIRKYRHQEK